MMFCTQTYWYITLAYQKFLHQMGPRNQITRLETKQELVTYI